MEVRRDRQTLTIGFKKMSKKISTMLRQMIVTMHVLVMTLAMRMAVALFMMVKAKITTCSPDG